MKFDRLSYAEVKRIDERIKSCTIENPDLENQEYYVKIYFNYRSRQEKEPQLGKREFIDSNKTILINEIISFLQDQTKGFDII